jgi:hypothetical protein
MPLNISIDVFCDVDISAISYLFDNNGYIYFYGYIDMKYLLFAMLIISGLLPSVWAAQLDATILTKDTMTEPSFQFLRIVYIEYPNGGEIADLLQGQKQIISFTADSQTPGMSNLVSQINENLVSIPSHAVVTDAKLNYQATLSGNEKYAAIEYKIELIPTITNHIIQNESEKSTIDSNWRGIKVDNPIPLDTKYGLFDINNPKSALDVMLPIVMKKIENQNIKILELPLMDASGILSLPLDKWHSLFDNTAIIQGSKEYGFTGKNVVTRYSMGECSVEVGMCHDRKWTHDFELDKKYSIKMTESQDDATIAIDGYVNSSTLGGIEIFETSLRNNVSEKPGTDEFPASVMYGMAGMAVIGGVVMFVISNRKLKKDQSQGQTGIDPAYLRSYETSNSAGSYKTNRGESYLIPSETSKMPIFR